jgi:hypothetical protein
MRTVSRALLMVLGVAATAVISAAQVKVEVSIQPSRITLHEPVELTFDVTNNAQNSVQIDLGRDRKENFKITLTTPTGGKIQLPQLRKSGLTRFPEVTIEAGENYHQTLVLNEWYDFKQVGYYKIEVELAKPALSNGAVVAGQQPFDLTLNVDPRDEIALANRCESLAADILEFPSYEVAAERALALSYVNDPVAVPYLKRILLANKLVEPIAIQGLERIATPDAVQALGSALTITMDPTSALARAALSKIEYETADPEVKEQIRRIMANPIT